eukprot:Lankesteria_metandrocarpae@DN2625_c0_g1_i1.p1
MALLHIDPEIIEFPLVLHQNITARLMLHNPSPHAVAFKIKTTAPKSYLVRPSTGAISCGGAQEIQIILQPMQTEPSLESPDRFLVQATPVTNLDTPSRDFWNSVPKDELTDQRLNVVFREQASDPRSTTNFREQHGTDVKDKYSTTAGDADKDASELPAKARIEELETETSQLHKELEEMKKLVQILRSKQDPSPSWIPNGFELWHVIPVVVLALAIVKYFQIA